MEESPLEYQTRMIAERIRARRRAAADAPAAALTRKMSRELELAGLAPAAAYDRGLADARRLAPTGELPAAAAAYCRYYARTACNGSVRAYWLAARRELRRLADGGSL